MKREGNKHPVIFWALLKILCLQELKSGVVVHVAEIDSPKQTLTVQKLIKLIVLNFVW